MKRQTPHHLIRNDIIKSISEKIEKMPLLLVVAPMGYGKTTIVRKFLDEEIDRDYIWLDFKMNETDEGWVWQRLCDNFKEKQISIWRQMRDLKIPESRQEIDYFIQMLMDKFKRPFYIVFDDSHENTGKLLFQLIEGLVYAKIPNLHIILISRTYLDIPFDEMQLKGYCYILEKEDLTLSKKQVKEFFETNEISLSEEEVNYIYKRSEGWLTAVYLMIINYNMERTIEDTKEIVRLMKTSIYDKLNNQVKELLMNVVLCDNFNAKQASYILDREISTELLNYYMDCMGFCYYDYRKHTYKLHNLIKAAINIELECSDIDKIALLNKHAKWYEKEKQYTEAIQFYERAGNTEAVFQIIEKEHCYRLYEKAPVIITHFFEMTSKELIQQHYIAYIGYILALVLNEKYIDGERFYKEAENYYKNEYQGKDKNIILGELLIVKTFCRIIDIKITRQLIKEAYQLLNGNSSKVFDYNVLKKICSVGTIMLWHTKQGQLRETTNYERESNYYYIKIVNDVEGGWYDLPEVEYQFAIGNIEEASKLAKKVLETAGARNRICIMLDCYLILLRCNIYNGKKVEFIKNFQQMKLEMELEDTALFSMDYDFCVGFICGLIGDLEHMPKWIFEFRPDKSSPLKRRDRNIYVCYARILVIKRKWNILKMLGEQLYLQYQKDNYIYLLIYANIYNCIASLYLGEKKEAKSYLRKGLLLAKLDNIVMPFVEYSTEFSSILEELGNELEIANNVLFHYKYFKKGLEVFKENKKEINLTKREWELIHLVEEGLRNSQIGERLNISLATVEKTLSNIYRKLDVTNRVAAITKIKEYI